MTALKAGKESNGGATARIGQRDNTVETANNKGASNILECNRTVVVRGNGDSHQTWRSQADSDKTWQSTGDSDNSSSDPEEETTR